MKNHFVKRLTAWLLVFTVVFTQMGLPSGFLSIDLGALIAHAEENLNTFSSEINGYKLTYTITGTDTVTLSGYDSDYADAHPVTHALYMADQNGQIEDSSGKTYTVTAVADAALKGLNYPTSIHIPQTVETIGKQAFQSCTNVRYVQFASGSKCRSIGEQAFTSCSGIGTKFAEGASDSYPASSYEKERYNLELPKALETLGARAFEDCSGLQRVTFLGDTTSIGDAAFASLIKLSTVKLPANATAIGASVFANCSSLKAANIPASLTVIPEKAFYRTGLLTSDVDNYRDYTEDHKQNIKQTYQNVIHLPATLEKIETYAFTGCMFEILTLPDALVSIGDYAFQGSAIYDLEFNDKLEVIGKSAFQGCAQLGAKAVDNNQYIYYPVLPDNNLKTIGDSAFAGCQQLFNFRFSAGTQITSIGKSAFSNTQLTSFSIPDTISEISDSMFADCSHLGMISVPRTLEKIGKNAFAGDTDFAQFQVRSGSFSGTVDDDGNSTEPADTDLAHLAVTSIGESAFTNTGLVNFDLPKGVTAIEANTFSDCVKLVSFTFNGTELTGIDDSAFAGDKKLERFTVPENANLSTLGSSVFKNCSSLKTCNFGNNATIKAIPTDTFSGCSSLEQFALPATVTAIDANAFAGCSSLTTVSSVENLVSIGSNAFKNCQKLKGFDGNDSLTLPVNFSTLGNSAFENCTSLTKIDNLGNLTTINSKAFYNCTGITEVTIPATISTINAEAFAGCPIAAIHFFNTSDIRMQSSARPCFTFSKVNIKISCYEDMVESLKKSFQSIGMELADDRFTDKMERPAGSIKQGETKSKNMTIGSTWTLTRNKDYTALDKDGNPASTAFSWHLTNLNTDNSTPVEMSVAEDGSSVTIKALDIGSATLVGTIAGIGSVVFDITVKPNSNNTDIQNPYLSYTIYDITDGSSEESPKMVGKYENGQFTLNSNYDASIYSNEEKKFMVSGQSGDSSTNSQDAFYWQGSNQNITLSPGTNASAMTMIDKSAYIVGNQVILKPNEKPAGDKEKITLTTKLGKQATIDFTVKYKVDSLSYGPKAKDTNGKLSIVADNQTTLDLKNSSYLNVQCIDPTKKYGEKLLWKSADPSIVSVDENGVIKGVKLGTTKITVTAADSEKSLTFEITVINPINAITPGTNTSGISIFPGETTQPLEFSFDYQATASASEDTLDFTLSDPSKAEIVKTDIQNKVAYVTIKGKTPGNVRLTASSRSKRADERPNASQSISLTIQRDLQKIDLKTPGTNTQSIGVNATVGLKNLITLTPSSFDDKLEWESTNPSVATVDASGMVKGVGTGSCTVRAICKRTNIALDFTIQVSVIADQATATPASVGTTDAPFYVGDSVNVALATTSAGGTVDANAITWESSDEKIVTVSNASASGATLTAVGTGSATIALKNSMKKPVGTIRVSVSAGTITLDKTNVQLYTKIKKRKSYKLNPTVKGHSQNVSYTSSNNKVATVSPAGIITAKKNGNATITATANGVSVTCSVNVNAKVKAKYSVTCGGSKIKKNKITLKKKAKTATVSVTTSWTVDKKTFKSSKKKVATITPNGVLKLKKKGKTKITVIFDGYKKTFTVTVK